MMKRINRALDYKYIQNKDNIIELFRALDTISDEKICLIRKKWKLAQIYAIVYRWKCLRCKYPANILADCFLTKTKITTFVFFFQIRLLFIR